MPPKYENGNGPSQELTKALSEFKQSVVRTGFNRGATQKNLEYIERTTAAITKQKRGDNSGESPEVLKTSLEQFSNIKYDELAEHAKKYRMPALFEFISPEAKINNAELTEFALATRAVPTTEVYKLDPKILGNMEVAQVHDGKRIVFGDIDKLAFSPDKILAGCLTSKDKGTFYYPHFDSQGKLSSTSAFECSPYQFYLIERQAREILAENGVLRQLYPDKVVKTRKGDTIIRQKLDSVELMLTDNQGRTYTWGATDGLLDMPVNETETQNILYRQDNGTDKRYAAYNDASRSMIVGDTFIDDISNPDHVLSNGVKAIEVAEMTARHELSHGTWNDLSDMQREKVLAMFDPTTNKELGYFSWYFLSDDHYRTAAIEAARLPGENMQFNIAGIGNITVGKERVINELIAYATWHEVIDEETMNIMNRLNDRGEHKNPLQQAASAAIAKLTDEQKRDLERMGLVRSSEHMREYAKKQMEPLILGTKILAARRNKKRSP